MAKQTKQTSQAVSEMAARVGAEILAASANTETKENEAMSQSVIENEAAETEAAETEAMEQTASVGEYGNLKWNSTSALVLKAKGVTYAKINLPFYYETMAGLPREARDCVALHAHLAGQFKNNQTANAKARAARLAKAILEKDEAGIRENRALTEEEYLDIWLGRGPVYGKIGPFFPDIGRTGARLSDDERNRLDAARRAWAKIVADHNAALAAGLPPVLKSNKVAEVVAKPTKSKKDSQEEHDAAVKRWEEAQMAIYTRIMEDDTYAERFQTELDAVIAERGKAKSDNADTVEATADLL